MSFVDAMKSEIADLERQLEANSTYVKIRELKRLLSVYNHDNNTTNVDSKSQKKPTAQPSGTSGTIVSAVKRAISGRTQPTRTREIMEMLSQNGIKVGGSAPQNIVSSLLSKSDEFKSHGRIGWTLVQKAEGEVTEAPEGDLLSGNPSEASNDTRHYQPGEPPAQGREAVPGGGT